MVVLEGMAAAGGRHQNGIQGFGARGLAHAHHPGKGRHQILGQGLGVGSLPLVIRHGTAAALPRGDHHLHPIGCQHPHHRCIHLRLKQALHTTQHQSHPRPSWSLGGGEQGKAIPKAGSGEGGQQGLHGADLRPEQPGQATAAGHGLQP